jgi:hypothetical protein
MRLILAATAATLAAAPAAAQRACADRDMVTANLEAGYGERFAGGGLQSETSILEVWFSPEGGTWTVLLTHADGTSCILASGTHWREALPSERAGGVPG